MKVNGTIHNPHYYQWMKENGGNVRQPGAQVCGGIPYLTNWRNTIQNIKNTNNLIPYINEIANLFINRNTYLRYLCSYNVGTENYVRMLKKKDDGEIYFRISNNPFKINKKYYYTVNDVPKLKCPESVENLYNMINNLYKLHNKINHFDNVILYEYRQKCQRNNDNEDLRIRFIMKEIDEKNMKTQLVRRTNKKKKENRILQIYEVYSQVVSDVLRDIVENNTIENIIEKWDKVQKIRRYCNYELLKISKLYNQMVPVIDFNGYRKNLHFKDLKSETQEKYELYVDNILNHNVNITNTIVSSYSDAKEEKKEKILDNITVTEEDMEFINMFIKACIDKRRNRF